MSEHPQLLVHDRTDNVGVVVVEGLTTIEEKALGHREFSMTKLYRSA